MSKPQLAKKKKQKMRVIAVYPHTAGIHQAEEKLIDGDTQKEVLSNALNACPPGRYMSRLVADDRRTTVWEEGKGWLQDKPQ